LFELKRRLPEKAYVWFFSVFFFQSELVSLGVFLLTLVFYCQPSSSSKLEEVGIIWSLVISGGTFFRKKNWWHIDVRLR